MRRFIVVTGLSGAGKSQAMKSFEDLGFYCVDNVPPTLLPSIVDLASGAGFERIAIAPDVRTSGAFGDVLSSIEAVTDRGVRADLLFLDASDDSLVRRYSETRRKHPLGGQRQLLSAIEAERAELASIRARADRIWDTTSLTLGGLKERIVDAFARETNEHRLSVTIIAFGYKFGIPLDADLVFDVRFLPNPYYVADLRPLTGADAPVAAYLESLPDTAPFVKSLEAMLEFLLPRYGREGKSHLTIAIGCTGGRHRSVYISRLLSEKLRPDPTLEITLVERDIAR